MTGTENFVYDSEGNLTDDKSKGLKISYDWRGMPIEFIQDTQPTGSSSDTLFKLTMAYDGSGRRISKTRWVKKVGSQDWEKELVTHYTGIGTEVRESFTGPAAETKVVVNMPQGLGRYGIEDAVQSAESNASQKFEWYLKNHLGSTMLVYGTVASTNPNEADVGEKIAAYDYRAFGEMLELTPPATGKVTENFTGKEHDDEIALDYFGARYLDPMLGMWTSVDPKRQFASPYLYAGNGMNPVNGVDPDGNMNIFVYGGRIIYADDDDNDPVVHAHFPGGFNYDFIAPPRNSYLFSRNENGTLNIMGEKFDFYIDQKAKRIINQARQDSWFAFEKWGEKGDFDFKNAYYPYNPNTVGVLNRTIMTVRDVGNAIWGGWTRYKYLNPITKSLLGNSLPLRILYETNIPQRLELWGVSNGYAIYQNWKKYHELKGEDHSSRAMQAWGFENYKP